MPIKTTIAVPYFVMQNYLNGDKANRIASLAQHHGKVWIISITSPRLSVFDPEPLVKDDLDRIALEFFDVDTYAPSHFPGQETFAVFDAKMANKIVDFVRVANRSNTEDLLVANCHLGVSRSGAVSSFVRSVCGIDFSDWKRLNPQVIPNNLVLSLLHRAWEA